MILTNSCRSGKNSQLMSLILITRNLEQEVLEMSGFAMSSCPADAGCLRRVRTLEACGLPVAYDDNWILFVKRQMAKP
jgi:hypothetical protein